jgi:hypothetical protein
MIGRREIVLGGASLMFSTMGPSQLASVIA